MSLNLQLLKSRISTAKNIAQISRTLEMVSAVKIKRAQATMGTVEPYAEGIRDLAEEIRGLEGALAAAGGAAAGGFAASGAAAYPFITKGSAPERLLIAVGPDKGLCGPLVSNLIHEMAEIDDGNLLLVTVGSRLERAASRMKKARLIAAFPMGSGVPPYSLVYDLSRLASRTIMAGEASTLSVLFTRYVSFSSQIPVEVPVLPIETPSASGAAPSFVVEPGPAEVLDAILPHYLEVMLYWLVVEAYTSEQGARLLAMQNAKNNAQDTADSLTLVYNTTRQERITSEILDLANQEIGT